MGPHLVRSKGLHPNILGGNTPSPFRSLFANKIKAVFGLESRNPFHAEAHPVPAAKFSKLCIVRRADGAKDFTQFFEVMRKGARCYDLQQPNLFGSRILECVRYSSGLEDPIIRPSRELTVADSDSDCAFFDV